ncbi:hypothetical protein [Ichthyobacterium seriolicida]|uniref:DUF1735 domain-containing protein n=1 Tax=Ichthyobacterium seriolicida TaxID=242600 RepID=A0A1J1E4A5_9FLAO|nr:hypothetical protein [Ichthyobacterium seriolicida]BAV94150.1 hypothetical protein JBKA6_0137 [Ichthyobacterium seriolicida]
MKTKNLFKNLLSLLTLVLFALSCTKPSEGPKSGEEAKTDVAAKPLRLEIASVKFEKAGNLKGTDVSEFYEKLFITRTPARDKLASVDSTATANGYPTEFATRTEDIEGNNIFINLPYNSNFEKLSANATVKAVLTFKSVVDSVVLETPKTNIKGNSVEISFEINKDHFTSEKLKSANPVIKQVLKFSKAGFADKIYTVNFKFSESKSDLCTIGETGFKFTLNETGINAKTSFSDTAKANSASVVRAHYDTANSGEGKGKTSSSPIEFKLRKSANGELNTSGVADTAYFKADALELPDGAFIVLENDTYVNPITGIKKTNGTVVANQTDLKGASGNGSVEYNFTVVAQNGTSKKYYKLTINADS